jgi:3-oxoadipyl-CoA thiolase
MGAAYVIDAVRTPFGRYGGGLAAVRPDDLAAHAVRALLDRAPELDPGRVDDVLFGDANQAGEDNRNVARMAWLLNGLPTSVPGATINRLCASSLEAAAQASRAIETGDASIMLVGGVESMSRAPWVLLKTERPFPRDHQQLWSTTLGWRMVNPNMPEQWTISLGASAEKLAGLYSITREAQDEFALRSHQRAAAATDKGLFAKEVIPTWGRDEEGRRKVMTEDQCIRRDTSLEALGALKPVFMPEGGTVTAGNSSPLNVGAAALLVMSEERARELGLKPKVKVRAMAVAGVDPSVMGIGPVPATHKALERAGLKLDDIDLIEINEAFAAQTLADGRELGFDWDKVNVNGGAIALGHPIGASGARIVATLLHELQRRGGRYGLATLCLGGGGSVAAAFERV